MTTLIKKLQELGLPEKDATVYLALLKLESATVQQITKETDLNRSSLYVILERLQKRGLVSITGTRGVRKYAAAPPERFAQTIKEQAERYKLLSTSLKSALPDLASAHRGARYRPKVTVLEGRQGLIDGFEDSFNIKIPHIRVVSSGSEIYRTLPDYLPGYVKKRMEKEISLIGIHPNEPTSTAVFKRIPFPKPLDTHFLIPEKDYKFPADLGMYDDKTSFMSHTHLFTAIIKSKQIAELMRTMFDLAVGEARRIGEEYPKPET